MDNYQTLIEKAKKGFAALDLPDHFKADALSWLKVWLSDEMFAEYRRTFPNSSYELGMGIELTITDRPEKMPVWERLFEKYDVPAADHNGGTQDCNQVNTE